MNMIFIIMALVLLIKITLKILNLTLWNVGKGSIAEDLGMSEAWTRSEGKNPEGGLNAKGRASYKKGNLKPPVSAKAAKKSPKKAARRKSFCKRMMGMKKKLTSAKTANDPNSRINKALRKWDC